MFPHVFDDFMSNKLFSLDDDPKYLDIPFDHLVGMFGLDHTKIREYTFGMVYSKLAGQTSGLNPLSYSTYSSITTLIWCYGINTNQTIRQMQDTMRMNERNPVAVQALRNKVPGAWNHVASFTDKTKLETLCPAMINAYRSFYADSFMSEGAKTLGISEDQYAHADHYSQGRLSRRMVQYLTAMAMGRYGEAVSARTEALRFFEAALFRMTPEMAQVPGGFQRTDLRSKSPLDLLKMLFPDLTMHTVEALAEAAEGMPLSSPLMRMNFSDIAQNLNISFDRLIGMRFPDITQIVERREGKIKSMEFKPLVVLVYEELRMSGRTWRNTNFIDLFKDIFRATPDFIKMVMNATDFQMSELNKNMVSRRWANMDFNKVKFFSPKYIMKTFSSQAEAEQEYHEKRYMTLVPEYSGMKVRDLQKMYQISETEFMNTRMADLWPQYDGYTEDNYRGWYGNRSHFPEGNVDNFLDTTYQAMEDKLGIDIGRYGFEELRQLAMGKC